MLSFFGDSYVFSFSNNILAFAISNPSYEILKDLESIFKDVCLNFETELVEMNGEAEHIHLLLNYPPKVSISKLVNSLKGVSSRLIRKQHPELKKSYCSCGLWSPSYFASSCGGAPLTIIKEYIEQQTRPL